VYEFSSSCFDIVAVVVAVVIINVILSYKHQYEINVITTSFQIITIIVTGKL
jgi:ABC-type uncharacterized transport system involved in gliding motility auxiliary subunit